MDGWFLAMMLLMVGGARWVPVGPAIRHFLDLVWHRFPDAFGHGFGIDFWSLLDNFSIVFGMHPSTLEFEQFSIEFQLKINTLERWKFEFYSILPKKTEKWHVLILHAFRITLWIHFGIIFGTVWHEIPYFSAIVFPDEFLDVFLVALWANLAPNASQNGSRISKKNENCAILFRSGAPDSASKQIWIHFGRHFINFGSHLRCFGYLLVVI